MQTHTGTRILSAAFAVLAVLGSAQMGNATILFDNMAGAVAGSFPLATISPLYDSFSTGLNSGTLSLLELSLFTVSSPDGNSIDVGLYADSGATTPGALITSLGTVNDSDLGEDQFNALITVGLTSTPVLSAGTRYWIGLTTTNNSSGNWNFSHDDTGIGVSGEYNSNPCCTLPNTLTAADQMRVDLTPGTPSPDPATLTMAGSGLLMVGLRRILKRRTSAVER